MLSWKFLSGDIAVFAKCPKLTIVDVRGTNITGEFSLLFPRKADQSAFELLSWKFLSGDIAVFAHCPKLEQLRVGNTKITGEFSPLFPRKADQSAF